MGTVRALRRPAPQQWDSTDQGLLLRGERLVGRDGCFQFTSDHCDRIAIGGIGRLEIDLVIAIRVEADLVALVVGSM